jgi:hypothetical protein
MVNKAAAKRAAGSPLAGHELVQTEGLVLPLIARARQDGAPCPP